MFTCECKYSVSPEENNESPGSSVTGSCKPAEIDAGTKICPLEQQALLTKSWSRTELWRMIFQEDITITLRKKVKFKLLLVISS